LITEHTEMFGESNLALGYTHRNWTSYSCCGHCKMLHTELPFLQCSFTLSDRSLDADPLTFCHPLKPIWLVPANTIPC